MKRVLSVAATVAAICTLVACSTTPYLDEQFGISLATLKAQQVINPDAPRTTAPVTGLDGKAAKGALDNYRDSFRKPPSEASNVLSIGVGQGSTAK
jgi:hypothetical protein